MATYNGKFLILNRSGADRTGVTPAGSQLLLENDSTPYRKLWVGDGVTAGGLPVAAQAIISSLAEDATPDAANDYVVTWDTSAGVNKKVKATNLPAQAIISSLAEDTSPDAANDYVVAWDASAGVNKKVKAANLPAQAIISSLAEDATPDAANDYVVTWDASAGVNKKVKAANLPAQAIISLLTEDTSPDAANDYVVTWDASAGVNKKVKLSGISTGGGNPSITALGNKTGGTILVIDGSKGYSCTATGDVSFSFNLSGLNTSVEYTVVLYITQDGTGTRTLTFTGTNIDTPGAILAVPIAGGASQESRIEFRVYNSRVKLVNTALDLRNS